MPRDLHAAILPAHRRLTAAERDGFRMACACFATWGTQLAATSIRLGGRPQGARSPADQERLGRQMAWMAEALSITIGRDG